MLDPLVPVPRVPREELVAAVPGQRHLYMLASRSGDEIGRNGRGIAKGAVVMPDQRLEQIWGH